MAEDNEVSVRVIGQVDLEGPMQRATAATEQLTETMRKLSQQLAAASGDENKMAAAIAAEASAAQRATSANTSLASSLGAVSTASGKTTSVAASVRDVGDAAVKSTTQIKTLAEAISARTTSSPVSYSTLAATDARIKELAAGAIRNAQGVTTAWDGAFLSQAALAAATARINTLRATGIESASGIKTAVDGAFLSPAALAAADARLKQLADKAILSTTGVKTAWEGAFLSPTALDTLNNRISRLSATSLESASGIKTAMNAAFVPPATLATVSASIRREYENSTRAATGFKTAMEGAFITPAALRTLQNDFAKSSKSLKDLGNDSKEAGNLIELLARKGVNFGDEFARGQRGQLVSTFGSLIRESGLLKMAIDALSGPWGIFAAAAGAALGVVIYETEQAFQRLQTIREVTQSLLVQGFGDQTAKVTTDVDFNKDKYDEYGGTLRALELELNKLPGAAQSSRQSFVDLAEALARLEHVSPEKAIEQYVKAADKGVGPLAELISKTFGLEGVLNASGYSLAQEVEQMTNTEDAAKRLAKAVSDIKMVQLGDEAQVAANHMTKLTIAMGLSPEGAQAIEAMAGAYGDLADAAEKAYGVVGKGLPATRLPQITIDQNKDIAAGNKVLGERKKIQDQIDALQFRVDADKAAIATPGELNIDTSKAQADIALVEHQLAILRLELEKKNQDPVASRQFDIGTVNYQRRMEAAQNNLEAQRELQDLEVKRERAKPGATNTSPAVMSAQTRLLEIERKIAKEAIEEQIRKNQILAADENRGGADRVAALKANRDLMNTMYAARPDLGIPAQPMFSPQEQQDAEKPIAQAQRQARNDNYREAVEDSQRRIALAKSDVDQIKAEYAHLREVAQQTGQTPRVLATLNRDEERDLIAAQQRIFAAEQSAAQAQITVFNRQLAAFKDGLDAQVAAHKLSKAQEIAQEEVAYQQIYATEHDTATKILSDIASTPEQQQAAKQKIEELEAEHAQKMAEYQKQITAAVEAETKKQEQFYESMFSKIENGIESSISGLLAGTETFAAALKKIRDSAITSVADSAMKALSAGAASALAGPLGVKFGEGETPSLSGLMGKVFSNLFGNMFGLGGKDATKDEALLNNTTAINNLTNAITGKVGTSTAPGTSTTGLPALVPPGTPSDLAVPTTDASGVTPVSSQPLASSTEVGTQIASTLAGRGWSPDAITGALANGLAESGLQSAGKPGAAGEQGIWQFHPKTHLAAFEGTGGTIANTPESITQQTNYMADWVEKHMPGYSHTTGAANATNKFETGFEAPLNPTSRAGYIGQAQSIQAAPPITTTLAPVPNEPSLPPPVQSESPAQYAQRVGPSGLPQAPINPEPSAVQAPTSSATASAAPEKVIQDQTEAANKDLAASLQRAGVAATAATTNLATFGSTTQTVGTDNSRAGTQVSTAGQDSSTAATQITQLGSAAAAAAAQLAAVSSAATEATTSTTTQTAATEEQTKTTADNAATAPAAATPPPAAPTAATPAAPSPTTTTTTTSSSPSSGGGVLGTLGDIGSLAGSAAGIGGGLAALSQPSLSPMARIGSYIGIAGGAIGLITKLSKLFGDFKLPGLDKGSWEIPHDMPAVIHKGEMVIPAVHAANFRRVLGSHVGFGINPGAPETLPGFASGAGNWTTILPIIAAMLGAASAIGSLFKSDGKGLFSGTLSGLFGKGSTSSDALKSMGLSGDQISKISALAKSDPQAAYNALYAQADTLSDTQQIAVLKQLGWTQAQIDAKGLGLTPGGTTPAIGASTSTSAALPDQISQVSSLSDLSDATISPTASLGPQLGDLTTVSGAVENATAATASLAQFSTAAAGLPAITLPEDLAGVSSSLQESIGSITGASRGITDAADIAAQPGGANIPTPEITSPFAATESPISSAFSNIPQLTTTPTASVQGLSFGPLSAGGAIPENILSSSPSITPPSIGDFFKNLPHFPGLNAGLAAPFPNIPSLTGNAPSIGIPSLLGPFSHGFTLPEVPTLPSIPTIPAIPDIGGLAAGLDFGGMIGSLDKGAWSMPSFDVGFGGGDVFGGLFGLLSPFISMLSGSGGGGGGGLGGLTGGGDSGAGGALTGLTAGIGNMGTSATSPQLQISNLFKQASMSQAAQQQSSSGIGSLLGLIGPIFSIFKLFLDKGAWDTSKLPSFAKGHFGGMHHHHRRSLAAGDFNLSTDIPANVHKGEMIVPMKQADWLRSRFSDFGSLAKMNIPSFATGVWDVSDDMIAQLHKGEMVMPAPYSASFRSGDLADSIGAGSAASGIQEGDTHIHVHAIDQRSGAQFLMAHSDDIAKSFNKARRNFHPATGRFR
jgi:hypothetical protein